MNKVDVVNVVTTTPGLPASPFGQTGSPSITVPAGKHLVVETLSVQLDVTPSGSQLEAFVNYTCGGVDVSLFVPLSFAYTDNGTGYDFHVGMQAVRLYADPVYNALGQWRWFWEYRDAFSHGVGIPGLTRRAVGSLILIQPAFLRACSSNAGTHLRCDHKALIPGRVPHARRLRRAWVEQDRAKPIQRVLSDFPRHSLFRASTACLVCSLRGVSSKSVGRASPCLVQPTHAGVGEHGAPVQG